MAISLHSSVHWQHVLQWPRWPRCTSLSILPLGQQLNECYRYPISGGQYHWVALLAPRKHAKFLSWLTGWLSTLGWQGGAATGTYLGGLIIQSMVALNNPSYVPARWQGTLILYAVLLLTLFVNTVLVRILPGLEGLILILHVVGFFAIMIPVVYLAPISDNAFVWTEFNNSFSGYQSAGLSWLIGQSASAILFIGYDGACHMAEEVRDAALNVRLHGHVLLDTLLTLIQVPRAMFFTIFINVSQAATRASASIKHMLTSYTGCHGFRNLHIHALLLRRPRKGPHLQIWRKFKRHYLFEPPSALLLRPILTLPLCPDSFPSSRSSTTPPSPKPAPQP